MIVFMKCIVEAVVAKGSKGLFELVPGGSYIHDIASDAFKRRREKVAAKRLEDELKELLDAKAELLLGEARKAIQETAPRLQPREAALLAQYLVAVQESARQSMRRKEDPSGRSIPAGYVIRSAADVARLLPNNSPRFLPGDFVPNLTSWRLTKKLGGGGFGEVWLAEHTWANDTPAAFKFCTDPDFRTRLVTYEKELVVRVMQQGGRHPNIVPLLDCNLDGDTPWLKYEYVSGGTLGDLMRDWADLARTERDTRVTEALFTLTSAVGHFHSMQPPIVHRDLTPQNVLVCRSNGSDLLRITDFGIGGAAIDHAIATETQRGGGHPGRMPTQVSGAFSNLYASLEQKRGERPDPRDDVHALGVIAYQMMTGKLDEAPGTDAKADLEDVGAPEWLNSLITRSTSQKAARRPRDAGEMANELGKHILTNRGSQASASAASNSVDPKVAEELFKLFGDSGEAAGRRRRARQNYAATTNVSVPLEVAARGGTVTVQVGSRTIDVKVPPGTTDEKKLRIPAAATGAEDVLIQLSIEPHAFYRREGTTISLEVPISVSEAILGGAVEVPAIDGSRLNVKVPPGTSSGQKLRLRGKGLADGDMILLFKVMVPRGEVDEAGRQLIRQFHTLHPTNHRTGTPWE